MKFYLKSYLSFFVVGLIFVLSCPALYLYSAGEYSDLQKVVTDQINSSGKILYGTALFKNTHLYKKLLLVNSQPQIVVLGSSRVMQIRQSVFVKKMINIGGAMASINEGRTLAPLIIKKKPAVVLIGIDVWWFHETYQKPTQPYNEKEDLKLTFNLKHSYKVFEWLYEKKISFGDIFNTIMFGVDDFGVAGIEKNGFANDGSYYYTRLITGASKEDQDRQFIETIKRIENGSTRFQYASTADDQHVTNFVSLVRLFEENGIEVVLFFPPFAKRINEKLDGSGNKYSYIRDLKTKLRERGVGYYDYSDPALVESCDCEFIDGFHGGEVTYLRILSALSNNVTSLRNLLNLSLLQEIITRSAGKAFVPDEQITNDVEVDYLGLGCEK